MSASPQPPTGGGPDTLGQAPPGGTSPGAVPSGVGAPDQNKIPPAGAPGAQSVAPSGILAAANAFMAMGHAFIYKAMKLYPPGKQLQKAIKLYTSMAKDFELPAQDQSQGAMPQQAQGGGMPMPGMAPPPQMGPPPGGLPRGPAQGSTPLPAG